jgi:hypothetical protein
MCSDKLCLYPNAPPCDALLSIGVLAADVVATFVFPAQQRLHVSENIKNYDDITRWTVSGREDSIAAQLTSINTMRHCMQDIACIINEFTVPIIINRIE